MTSTRDWYSLAGLRNMAEGGLSSRASFSTLPAYEYDVEDCNPDTSTNPDAWAEFLRTRITRRKALYEGHDLTEKELIRKEVRRIRYFRDYFKDYRVFPDDDLPLVALLDDSRTKWRDIAARRAPEELAKCQRQIEKGGETPNLARNRAILRQVMSWHSEAYAASRKALDPDTYMDTISGPHDSSEDDPKKEDFGYNGWIIAWEKEKGWTSIDHPLVAGSFPHQKISIQQFLYNKEGTPLKRSSNPNQLRYFHLPANNMKWVEEAISRYYDEDNVEFDSQRVLTTKYNAQRLLRTELWRGAQRGGHNLPPHARQITPRCSVVPSAPWKKGEEEDEDDAYPRRDVAMFMPFLHWEVEKRLQRMQQFVQVSKKHKEEKDLLKRANTFRHSRRLAELASKQINSRRPAPNSDSEEKPRGRRHLWRPRNALAKYFWHVAKLHQVIDEAADGRLIEDHLYSPAPLHMRRTLEQYYYWTAEDTSRRDHDQIVCRGTKNHSDDSGPEATTRLVMVDQLWLWILDDNTVITSFPRRWGRNKPDPSAVHRSIRDRLGAMDPSEIHSAYDLALVIVDECSKVFFDASKLLDQRPEVIDLFGSAMSKIAENKTVAYEGFGLDLSKISMHAIESAETILRKSLNISFEWSIIEESQQVLDELQIMQEIFGQQITVLKDFDRFVHELYSNLSLKEAKRLELVPVRQGWEKARDRMESLVFDMEQRRSELKDMETLQTKTRTQLRDLVDMKQQQANIIEAKAAIRRADETVLQGRSIVVFTVVTIIFQPASFFASIFGMNNEEFSTDGKGNVNYQLRFIGGLSVAVMIVSLSFAFSNWMRTALSVSWTLLYTAIEDRLGWRSKKSKYSSTAFKNLQVERMKQLEDRDRARRLTEIDSRRMTSPNRRRQLQKGQQRSTWDVRRLRPGGFFRFRNNKSDNEGSNPV